MGFNNFCISGNQNECPLQASYLIIYFTSDGNMTSLSVSWHWWAVTVSAACVARLGAVAVYDAVDNGHHVCMLVFVPMVDTLNIPCDCQFFFCTWWTSCFTSRLMQWVIF